MSSKEKAGQVKNGSGKPKISFSGVTVLISDELTVEIPDGMTWSTDKKKIGPLKELVYFKKTAERLL